MFQEDDGQMDSTNGISKKAKAPALGILSGILGILLLIVITSASSIFFGVGKWLVREDALQPASSIAVLSGGIPTRALEAAALYQEGYAKEIWLTHPDVHDDSLKEFGITFPSEDEFDTRVLRRAGVPAKAIHVLETPVINTDEELDVISAALKARGGDRVIIVTNKAHTRRVHILWTKYFGSRGQAVVHGLPDDDYIADRWWRDPGSMTQVAHEVLGIMNAWAGLPVQRIPHAASEVVAKDSDAPPQVNAD